MFISSAHEKYNSNIAGALLTIMLGSTAGAKNTYQWDALQTIQHNKYENVAGSAVQVLLKLKSYSILHSTV